MKLTKAELENAQTFVKRASQCSNNAYFGWLSKGDILTSRDGPCHGGMNNGYPKYTDVKLIFSGTMRHHKNADTDDKDVIRFYDWIVNRSPFQEAFLEKDPEWIFNNCFVVNKDVPGNYLLGSLITSRMPTENYTSEIRLRFKDWLAIVDMGIDPSYAHIFCSMFKQMEDGWSYSPCNASHWAFYPAEYKEDYIFNYLTHNKVNSLPLYSTNGSTGGKAGNVWSLGEKGVRDCAGSVAKNLRPIKEVIRKNWNIFYKTPKDVHFLFRGKEEVASLFYQLDEWMTKINTTHKKVA